MRAKSENRWKIAQEYARRSWKSGWKSLPSAKVKTLVEEYWSWYLNAVKEHIPLNANDKILDIGCGPDGIINYVTAGKRYGLDPLMDLLIAEYEMPKDARWIKGAGEHLPFKTNSFSVVFSTNVLDHTKDPELILSEIYRIIKANGLLILTVDCYGPLHGLYRATMEKVGKGNAGHPFTFSVKKVEHLLKKSGFEIIENRRAISDLGYWVNKKLGFRERKLVRLLFWIDKKLVGHSTTDFLFVSKKL